MQESLLGIEFQHKTSGGATPGRARSNDLAGRSTALAQKNLSVKSEIAFASVVV